MQREPEPKAKRACGKSSRAQAIQHDAKKLAKFVRAMVNNQFNVALASQDMNVQENTAFLWMKAKKVINAVNKARLEYAKRLVKEKGPIANRDEIMEMLTQVMRTASGFKSKLEAAKQLALMQGFYKQVPDAPQFNTNIVQTLFLMSAEQIKQGVAQLGPAGFIQRMIETSGEQVLQAGDEEQNGNGNGMNGGAAHL